MNGVETKLAVLEERIKNLAGVVSLTANDTIQLFTKQVTGGNANIQNATDHTWLTVQRIL